MPIRCVCPNGHTLRVKDQLAGKQGTCPKCQAPFVVPSRGEPVSDAAQEATQTPTAPPVTAPADEAAVEWRMAHGDGQQYGPTVPTLFAQWIASGRVTAETLVWRTGWPEWRRAGDAADQLPAPLAANAPPPLPPMAGGGSAADPPTPPGATLPPPAPETDAAGNSQAFAKPSRPTRGPQNYAERRALAAKRRFWLTVGLAVLCVALAGMLFWLVTSPAAAS